MKILIAYYSRTGCTEKLAEAIKKRFEEKGHSVDVEKINPVKDLGFWGWSVARIFKRECNIMPLKINNVSEYDAVCIGSPNWTKVSLPVARYINTIKGLKGKNVGTFATTTMWPALEWFMFSAYFLELTFARAIEKKMARVVSNILLSSLLKWIGINSVSGKKEIDKFCEKIESASGFSKDYLVRQREVVRNRALLVIFPIFFIITFFAQVFLPPLGIAHFTWLQYAEVIIPGVLAIFSILIIIKEGRGIFLTKYIACFYLFFAWTMTIYFFNLSSGVFVIPGYMLILFATIFFQELKLVIYSGLAAFFCYAYLYFFHSVSDAFYPQIDIAWLFCCALYASFITKNLQNYSDSMIKIQEETETERATLEIRVNARTRELRELAAGLDNQVKDKTKELLKKIEELEKFGKIAIGRELRMMELKKEIKELRAQIEGDK